MSIDRLSQSPPGGWGECRCRQECRLLPSQFLLRGRIQSRLSVLTGGSRDVLCVNGPNGFDLWVREESPAAVQVHLVVVLVLKGDVRMESLGEGRGLKGEALGVLGRRGRWDVHQLADWRI